MAIAVAQIAAGGGGEEYGLLVFEKCELFSFYDIYWCDVLLDHVLIISVLICDHNFRLSNLLLLVTLNLYSR